MINRDYQFWVRLTLKEKLNVVKSSQEAGFKTIADYIRFRCGLPKGNRGGWREGAGRPAKVK